MAWLQRVAFLLQRSSTLPALTRAGLGANLRAPVVGASSARVSTAFATWPVSYRPFSVPASLEEDDIRDVEFEEPQTAAMKSRAAVKASPEAFAAKRKELMEILGFKDIPRKELLLDLIENSCTEEHIDDVLETLKRVKLERAFRRQQLSVLAPQLSISFALACIRVGAPEKGLLAVQHRNPYGLRPSLDAAHVLIDDAGERDDAKFAIKVFRTMLQNGVNPRPNTAGFVLRAVGKDRDKHSRDFFRLAEEFFINGIMVWPQWYEKLMSRASSIGDHKEFLKWARRREGGGLPISKRIAFILARGYIMMYNPKKAADILARARANVTDKDMSDNIWDHSCKRLVTQLPTWLSKKTPPTKIDFDQLKSTLMEVERVLKAQGVRFEVDVEKEYVMPETRTDGASEGSVASEASGVEDIASRSDCETGGDNESGSEEPASTSAVEVEGRTKLDTEGPGSQSDERAVENVGIKGGVTDSESESIAASVEAGAEVESKSRDGSEPASEESQVK